MNNLKRIKHVDLLWSAGKWAIILCLASTLLVGCKEPDPLMKPSEKPDEMKKIEPIKKANPNKFNEQNK